MPPNMYLSEDVFSQDIPKQCDSLADLSLDGIIWMVQYNIRMSILKKQISVIGASEASIEAILLAEEVGRGLGERGVTVVTWGLPGAMEAASRGAKEAGGTTIGILPGSDPAEANPYVDIPFCTGIGYARNVIVVRSGRAVIAGAIAGAGAFGALSEIAHALGRRHPGHRTENVVFFPQRATSLEDNPGPRPQGRGGEGPGCC